MISRKVNLEHLDESKKYRVGAYSARYLPKAVEKGALILKHSYILLESIFLHELPQMQ